MSARATSVKPLIPSGVLGMLIFVLTELMFFLGLISAFVIVKAGAPFGWPPPDQPRLPVEITAINSAALVLSGVALYWAHRRFKDAPASAKVPFLVSIALGSAFVLVQGGEWTALLGQGLTITSGPLGAFFYLIVGAHAAHAIAAILALGWAFSKLLRDELEPSAFWTVQTFWYFVVGIWPLLYVEVYL
ncbi:MAG: cytochrome c oxidase subunit 3 [Sandaracinaceae bacterium]|nr:cytochrome c oxidase subunit 3 [Sandaracinaceae bacterium]